MQIIYVFLFFLLFSGCNSNYKSEAKVSLKKSETFKCIDIIRRPTLFDRKDTNSRVGKCYKKINENLSYFVEVEPIDTVNNWQLPFDIKNRNDTNQIKIISPFGVIRTSHFRGHKHSGADIVPINRDTGIYIYPVAKGIVCFKIIKDPFSSIFIKHKLGDGSFIYTSYIHLKNVYVENGDTVDTRTKIGKLFTRKEARRFGGPYNHLHFEVRKNIDDLGFGSAHCMTKSELDSFFYEPIGFLTEKIRETNNGKLALLNHKNSMSKLSSHLNSSVPVQSEKRILKTN